MMTQTTQAAFVGIGIRTLARTTGVSLSWLDPEAPAGRIPLHCAGRHRLFDVATVEDALKAFVGDTRDDAVVPFQPRTTR